MGGRLEGKVALVTGASRGIGAATARRLAADGARLLVHYNSSAREAEALAAEIGGTAIQADLEAPDCGERLAPQVEGRLDILVNNAGVADFGPLGRLDAAHVDRHWAVNVRAPLLITQAFIERMGEGGRIVFTSSIVAQSAFMAGMALAYAASKGAVDTLVVHLAAALGPRGITVNAVAPGAIETDMAAFLKDPAAREGTIAGQALKRVGQPEDVADVIAFLASEEARWVTGQVIAVSGGTKL